MGAGDDLADPSASGDVASNSQAAETNHDEISPRVATTTEEPADPHDSLRDGVPSVPELPIVEASSSSAAPPSPSSRTHSTRVVSSRSARSVTLDDRPDPDADSARRSVRVTTRDPATASGVDEEDGQHVGAPTEDSAARESAAFRSWGEESPELGGSPYKIGPFVLLLLDEFCRHYALAATASALQKELQELRVDFPDGDLWFEMYALCSKIIGNKKHTDPHASATTIERLVEFCVTPLARKAVFSLDMATTHSLMHNAVPASPPTKSAYSSIRRVPVSTLKKKKKRKARPQRSQSVVSVMSHGSPQRDNPYGHNQPQLLPGTFGEPVLVDAHKINLKRDLTSTRLLEKELRNVRLETITSEPKKSLQKRLGFHTLTAEERSRQQLQDPYANELIMEKYGFSKRQDCALCQFPFLLYNLPHKVSFKCVMDVYDHWNFSPPDRDTSSKYKAPFCYDAVHVCRMCAQLVFQHAKQPDSQLLLAAARPLSRKHKKAKSLANLHQVDGPEEASPFCSDPYALPPLLGDDVYDHRDDVSQYMNGVRRMRGVRGDGDAQDADPRAGLSEFPAKAIIYSQQMESSQFMTSKEWDVINPEKSVTRHRIETTLLNAARKPSRS